MAEMSGCDWLVPVFDELLGDSKCLLDQDHKGNHLCIDKSGNYFIWSPDSKCGCGDPECEDFLYNYINQDEAQEILKKQKEAC